MLNQIKKDRMQGVGIPNVRGNRQYSNPRTPMRPDISSEIAYFNGNYIYQILSPTYENFFFSKESGTVDQAWLSLLDKFLFYLFVSVFYIIK